MIVRNPKDKERAQRMADLYRSGKTLQEIGDEYGLTRERVRQIIGFLGLARNSGGQCLRAIRRAIDRRKRVVSREEMRYVKWLGVPKSVYVELTGQEWSWAKFKQPGAAKNPGSAFVQQKRNAIHSRRIAWELSFSDWWRIWQESGKWGLRGRGKGYCMARHGDSGPYSVANVYICTIGQNFSDSYLVHPWSERFAAGAHVRQKERDELGMTPQERAVWDARRGGATFGEIGRRLGVKSRTASRYYYRAATRQPLKAAA